MAPLSFRVDDSGDTKNVSYDENMLVKDFISAFLSSNNIYNTSNANVYTFKVGSKVINSDRFMNKKLTDIIKSGGLVKIFRKQGIHYSK
jgi:hypothetical protein